MEILNFLNDLSSSDIIFYALMILLTLVSVILFYLIYTQNKEMSKKMMEKSVFTDEDVKVVKEPKETPISINEVEALDTKTELVEPTNLDIPDPLELTKSLQINDEMADLQSLTKELETIPRERTIRMTPYEAEQEETAIISYDELVQQSDKTKEINYIPTDEVDLAVSQVDNNIEIPVVEEVEVENKVEIPYVEDNNYGEDVIDTKYFHEESFLSSLKKLQYSMKEND